MTFRMLLTLLLCGLLIQTTAMSGEIFRADFEEVEETGSPPGWTFKSAKGESFGTVDASEPKGGHSIRLHIPKDETARAHWIYGDKIALKPSTGYRLKVRAMVAEVEGEAYLIIYENGVEGPSHWHLSPKLNGTIDWHDQTVEFVTRPDTEYAVMRCKLRHGTGYAWFDDIVIEEADIKEVEEAELHPPRDDGFTLQAMWTPAQWCKEDGEMRLLRDLVNPCAIFFWGKREMVKDPALILTAEDGLLIHGPIICGRRPAPKFPNPKPEPCERDGARCLRWRFPILADSLLKGMRPDGPHWEEYHFLYFEPTDRCPDMFQLDWQIETSGRRGPVHSLKGSVTEIAASRLAKQPHFKIHVQHTGGLRHPDPAIRKRLMNYLMCAGMTGGLSMTYWVPEDAPADEQFRQEGFDLHTWRFFAYESLGQTDHPLIKEDGTVWKGKMCPTALLQKAQPFYGKLVEYFRGKLATGLKTVIIDYEPPVHNVCFCGTCRGEFAKHANLPAQKIAVMTPEEIFAHYDEAWGKFRAWQNGEVVKIFVDAIHEVDWEVKVGLCSSHRHPWTVARGMDIALFEPAAAFHAPMIYRKGTMFHDLIQSTCDGTKAPVRPFIELSDISQSRYLTPQELRMNLLATALSGGRGAFMWVGLECFDADYIMKIRNTYLDVSRFSKYITGAEPSDEIVVEPLFDSERLVKVDGRAITMTKPQIRPFIRWHVWKGSDGYLVGVMNHDKNGSYRVRVQAAKATEALASVEDLLQPARVWDGDLSKGLILKLPPEDAFVIFLRMRK